MILCVLKRILHKRWLTPAPPYGQPDRKISAVFFTPRLIKKTSTQCCLKKVGQCVFIAKTCWQPFPIARCMGGYAILSYHALSFTSSLVASLAWIRVHWVSNFNSSHLTHKLKSLEIVFLDQKKSAFFVQKVKIFSQVGLGACEIALSLMVAPLPGQT